MNKDLKTINVEAKSFNINTINPGLTNNYELKIEMGDVYDDSKILFTTTEEFNDIDKLFAHIKKEYFDE